MNYRCIRGVVTSQGPKAVGDVFSGIPAAEAASLMAYGKIVPVDEAKIEVREPVIESRDPEPLVATTRGRGRPRKL